MNTPTLSTRAMLVTLKISKWAASKQAKDAKAELAATKNADEARLSVSKKLVSKDATEHITKAEGEARTYWRENTLPWLSDGTRILPAAKFADFSHKMAFLKTEFEIAVQTFIHDYQQAVNQARNELGTMFVEADYPAVEELARKYKFETIFAPIPDNGDWRVELSQEQTTALAAQLQQQLQEQHSQCINEVAARLKDAVGNIAEKLAKFAPEAEKLADRGVFRDSLISNLKDVLGILPSLNMFDDPALASFIEKAQKLTIHEPAELRKDSELRKQTAEEAQAMLAELEGFMGQGSF